MKHTLTVLTALVLAPLAALHAAEPVTVDLAKRTWQGIPGLERTANGRVFVSWFTGGTKEPEPENTVVLSHSDDGGKTFSAPQVMGLPLSDGTRCYDPCLWIDPKGRLWYLFNRSVKDSTRHGVYARICDAPDASPPVWGAEFRVGCDSPFSFRMNKPVVLSTGEWALPVVHALEPLAGWAGFDPKQVFGAAVSTDEGKTWKLHGAIKTEKAGLENMIVELKDGRLWMLIRTEKVLWESYSSDKGRTWTPGNATRIATPHSRFFIRRLASGHLLLVNHHKFTGRSHLTAQLSTDDGATWNDGLLLDERSGVSYPDGVQDKDGLIWITYDRDRGGAGEILLAKFKEEDVAAGKNVSGAVSLKQIVNKLDKPSLLPANWDPALAGGIVLQRLVKVTAPQVKGAHDAEFVCVGDRAYIVASANDVQQGENPEWPFMYVTMSIVNLKSLKLEKAIDFAESERAFENQTLPAGACIVPRIIRKDDGTLRCYFDSNDPGKQQSQVWYRDFDLKRGEFAPTLHKAKLKTAAGTSDFQPQYLHADAAAQGFTRVANDSTIHIFDSFKRIDGRIYVALNNFRGRQNALALVHDDLETFEVFGHFNQPESAALSESAVNRLPDGTWMAVVRSDIPVRDGGNYHFATSQDGRTWTAGRQMPHVPNGINSKPTFDRFGDIYYLGWQESTRIKDASGRFVDRSVFNVDISRDGRTWERKYRFEAPESFQYPTFHEHNGAVWLTVTQGDEPPHRKARIMFGKLEDVGQFESQARKTRKPLPSPTELPASIRPDPKWTAQAAEDAEQDFTSIPFDGKTPNKLACDTTLRELPDGSWVMVMLGGGDREPLPENQVFLTRSHDKGKTWSPMQPLDFGFPREGDTIAMVPSELMVRAERCTLFFATHDGTFAGWKEWMTHSEDSCRTWSKPEAVPGRLHDRTFVRNHIVARDGRILLPFQHYLDAPSCKNPRNGVLMSADGGKTWTEHGNIRITPDDRYHGWAENNIAELADGRIAMIIRADKLGGVLYFAESKDGGKTWPEFAVKSDIPNPGSKATLYPLGGDTVALLHNPNPKGRHPLALWISFDGMKTWPYQRVLVEHSSDGPGRSLNYPDGFVSKDKQWLHFAYDDNRHRAVHYSAKLRPLPAPKAADAPRPAVKVTQELLNSIHVTPKLIFDPFPAYAQKYLPFAMAASMESTSKGRLWTCWAGGQDGPNAYLLASYSDDQGKSWRDPVFVIDPQAHGLKMGTRLGSFWCDPKGRLWLFFHQSAGMFDGSCSNWFVRCDDPDAEKPVWAQPVYIGFGASLNKPFVRKNGEWILPVSLWERWHIDKPFADCYRELDAVRGANVFVSDDEGASWRYRGGIIFKDSCFNEHSVVEKQDGTLWMLSRGMKEAFQSFSTDGGKTWQPQTTFFPHVNSKAVFRRLQSANLLLIRHGAAFDQQPKDRTEEWNWGKGRSHLTAFLSTDDGKTWSSSLLLDERHPVSYHDIAQAPNGDIYVHYDRDRGGAAEILFARFREEDVKAGKPVSKDASLKNVVKSKLGMNHGSSGK
jgi:hypothetical protein